MKKAVCIVLAFLILLFATTLPGYAHGSRFFYRGSVWVGPAWGPWWWYPAAYPYYAAPPVVIQQQPVYEQQTQQPEEQSYWYYCQDPKGYYPYIKKCPKGWMKVVPSPEDTEE